MQESKEKAWFTGKRKIILIFIAAFVAIGCMAFLFHAFDPHSQNQNTYNLVITNLSVGKADCAIIQCQDTVGIIDTGTKDSYDTVESFIKNNSIDSFDFMVITHYDKDHIGGAVPLLEKYKTDRIYIPDYVSEKKYYNDLMTELDKHTDVLHIVTDPVDIELEDLNIRIIPADDPAPLLENEKNRDNNMSLLCLIQYGSKRFFFTGDIENERMAQIVNSDEDIRADWIKIPHHGHYDKQLKALLDKVSPADAVISTSYEYAPDQKLLKAINDRKINGHDTMSSNVTTVCNGSDIIIK